jgi:hypothetical protein
MPIPRALKYNSAATPSAPGVCGKFRFDGLISRQNDFN